MTGEDEHPPFDVSWRRADPTERDWEDKSDKLEYDALTNVRAGAEKWAASLAAILGLFGTVMLVKGREDISKLASGYEIAVAVLLLIAFAAAALATYKTALAAQGTPETVEWPGGGELRAWEKREALKAKERLRESRELTFAAVICVLVAIGLTWFGEAEGSSAQAVVATAADEAPRCGTLVLAGDALALKESSGTTPLAAGTTFTAVSSCPKP
jgi:hypothetical protein